LRHSVWIRPTGRSTWGFSKPIERNVAVLAKDRHASLFSVKMPKSTAALAEPSARSAEGRDHVEWLELSVIC
jgi:hypothetical protein